MRIGLVNDMAMVIRVLEQAVNSIDECEVAWVARNGKEAITMCRNDRPDLVLMDLIMPEMNGVESTREIMKSAPCPILIVTSSVTENASMVFEAMGAGALDAISTPILMPGGAIKDAAAGLQGKISTVKRLIKAEAKHKKHKEMKVVRPEKSDQWLCVIGASTGGPHALSEILRHLPKDIGAAVVIVQHVDQHFAAGMAEWLNEKSVLPVQLARPGDQLTPGKVWLSGTNDHLVLDENGRLAYTREPASLVYRPSVNVLFDSVADNWHGKAVAVLLTGMGADGAAGLLRLRNAGVHTIAQNKETCAVYGMPKAAVELNAAIKILPLGEIAREINRTVTGTNLAFGT